ncbi:MAG: heavy metal translocating P-type ATPase [Nitrospirae bacterium]|nr:MAG: heavy metal translocating P-type ATPase [Nitrospirota bacterium]
MSKCDHCLLEFPEKDTVSVEVKGSPKIFCCNGCAGIYRFINEEGLDRFYRERKWEEAGQAFSKGIDLKPFEGLIRESEKEGLKEIDVFIDGIRCASCVWLNEKILGRTEGVEYARLNYATHKAKIRWDPLKTDLGSVLKRIVSIGYQPKAYSESEHFIARKAETRDLLIRFGTAGFLSSQLMIYSAALYAGYFQGMEFGLQRLLEVIAMLLTVPALFYSGAPFFAGALRGLRHFQFNMDFLIATGAGSAFLYSLYQMFSGGEVYFDTAVMIITLILLGRYIEAAAKGRASETIERLSELTPKEASRIRPGSGPETVPITSVQKGDLLQIKPGERIPLDGVVSSGESEVDESVITGESKPVGKTAGSAVIGGTMNLFGSFVLEVSKTANETVLAGIIRAVEDAQAKKPRIQNIADVVVGYFVPVIILLALATTVYYFAAGRPAHFAIMTGISVIVIACPCSLGLATPLAVMVFTLRASAKGILIKGGEVIENSARVDHVVFDKTGTITQGKPQLKDVLVLDAALSREECVSLASAIESLSEHSLGKAVCAADMSSKRREVLSFKASPGKGVEGVIEGRKIHIGNRRHMISSGVPEAEIEALNKRAAAFEAEGDTVIFMSWDKALRAAFVVSDMVRPEAAASLRELNQLGLEVSMVSGDNAKTTSAIAHTVGIKNALPEVLPVGKKDFVEALHREGKKTVMAGDGINDAPALTAASVGVAMGRGTDIAMESADAVLVRNDLNLIPYFIRLSRRTYSIIKQNIFWSFFYNIVAVPLAVAGILHPIVAAGAMAASSLFVVFNSLRIRK